MVILKNLKEVSWAGAKSMMADTGFLKGLVEFDKDSLSEKQVWAASGTLANTFQIVVYAAMMLQNILLHVATASWVVSSALSHIVAVCILNLAMK